MSRQEKSALVVLFSSLILFAVYLWRLSILYSDGRFSEPDAASLLGKSFIALVLAGIVMHIAIALASRIVAPGLEPEMPADERDTLIELKGALAFLVVLVIGFIAAMLALALGVSPVAILFALIVAVFLGSIADDLTKLYLYRRGF